MLYMVIEHFKNRDAKAVYARAREHGRMLPEGLTYVASWVETSFDWCFQVMECADERRLHEWVERWSDLVDFELVPVRTSADAAAAVPAENRPGTNMTTPRTYRASCHCGAIRFTFIGEEITSGRRCNCSICIRKGTVMSSSYFRPSDVEVEGKERLAVYQFGDRDVNHFFCPTCGISPFNTVASVPPDYRGPARPGDYRLNLGCVHDLDVLSLDIQILDGRAL